MAMRARLFCCITTALAFSHAAVVITKPQAGTNVVLRTGSDMPYFFVETAWTDDGNQPATSELSEYSLYLMMGGNLPENSKQISINASGQHLEDSDFGVIGLHADAAESLEDGFYVKLIALAKTGGNYSGSMTFYSHRFNLIGLTGSLSYEYQAAAAALRSTQGPATVNNLTRINGDESTPTNGSSISTASDAAASSPPPDPPVNEPELGTTRREGIGIGIGTALGTLLSITVVVLAYPLRRKRQQKAAPDRETTDATIEKAELPGDGRDRPELEHVDPMCEKSHSGKISASREQMHIAELPTDWTGWEAPALLEVELSRPMTMCASPTRLKSEVGPS